MDHPKGPPLAPSAAVTKPEGPKLRRKLQKGGAKQRSYLSKRPGSGASNDTSADEKPQHGRKQSPPLPPDLSDSRWPEYLRARGYLCAVDSTAESRKSLAAPISIIRDLYHPDTKYERERPQMDKNCSVSPSPSPPSPMKRRAKTPILSIANLEAASAPRTASAQDKTSSVELIAEQYRALLESRDDPMLTDSHSEPPPSRQEVERPLEIRRQHSSSDLRDPQPVAVPPAGSPTSDDETLVSFEEETVYFKPVSFSPEPLSPISSYEQPQPHWQPLFSPSLAPESLSLQICVDLLTRDLSSAIIGDNNNNSSSSSKKARRAQGPESSALQVWVMIEAYERLRDQVVVLLDSRPGFGSETRGLEMMFDMWLRALYAIHDSLAGDGLTTSEDDFEEQLELAAEELD